MNRDDIIKMARDSGMELYGLGRDRTNFVFILERFAALVAEPLQSRIKDLYRQLDEVEKRLDEQYAMGVEAEREACAKLCDEYVVPASIAGAHPDYLIGKQMAFAQAARAIRERGEA
jgi:hypothetical protein